MPVTGSNTIAIAGTPNRSARITTETMIKGCATPTEAACAFRCKGARTACATPPSGSAMTPSPRPSRVSATKTKVEGASGAFSSMAHLESATTPSGSARTADLRVSGLSHLTANAGVAWINFAQIQSCRSSAASARSASETSIAQVSVTARTQVSVSAPTANRKKRKHTKTSFRK